MSSERAYQRGLTQRLRVRFPGCKVFRNDPTQEQGIPDLLVLYGGCWAMLEVKKKTDSRKQANQDYRVDEYNKMSFAAFINADNEEEVLDALQQTFRSCGAACVS